MSMNMGRTMRTAGRLLLVLYVIGLGVLAALTAVWAWRVVERAAVAPVALPVRYVWFDLSVSAESSIFLVVVSFGVLGSVVHVATSLSSYLGNGRFRGSWATWYLLRPLIAAALATVAYVTFRAGFLSADASAETVNLFGVAAISALAGLFSKQVADKLEDVMNVVFSSARDDERLDKLQRPTITKVTPPSAVALNAVTLTIEGTAFGDRATVVVGQQSRTPATSDGDRLTVDLLADDLPHAGHQLEIRVCTASGETSEPFVLRVT